MKLSLQQLDGELNKGLAVDSAAVREVERNSLGIKQYLLEAHMLSIIVTNEGIKLDLSLWGLHSGAVLAYEGFGNLP